MAIQERVVKDEGVSVLASLGFRFIHRWRYKLLVTLGVIPLGGIFVNYSISELSKTSVFYGLVDSGLIWKACIIYGVGLLSVLWFGPVRNDVSESFVEMDLRRRQGASTPKQRILAANNKLIAVMGGDGNVRYYPKGSPGSRGKSLEEYLASQVAEVERMSVDVNDVAELAASIDATGVLKSRRIESSGEVSSELEFRLATSSSNAEAAKKNIYVSQFVLGVESAIKRLEDQILSAEDKASGLLDSGRKYLKNGIYFYAASILAWQVILYKLDYQWNWGLGFGVVSCSLAFIAVEFLAAWFLKQYRHYDDSIQTYMMVRSVYERYLLSYYVVEEYSEVEPEYYDKCRGEMLKAISEGIKWPDLKDVNSNDFNYMVASLESVAGLVEKMKGISVKSSPKAGVPEA